MVRLHGAPLNILVQVAPVISLQQKKSNCSYFGSSASKGEMPRYGDGGLDAFFRSLEEDVASQRETGFAAAISEEMRDRVRKIKKTFALPQPPKPEPRCEEPAKTSAAAAVSNEDVAPAKHPIHECRNCLRIFALKKTLAMHAKICSASG